MNVELPVAAAVNTTGLPPGHILPKVGVSVNVGAIPALVFISIYWVVSDSPDLEQVIIALIKPKLK